jgi:hypothetical protein
VLGEATGSSAKGDGDRGAVIESLESTSDWREVTSPEYSELLFATFRSIRARILLDLSLRPGGWPLRALSRKRSVSSSPMRALSSRRSVREGGITVWRLWDEVSGRPRSRWDLQNISLISQVDS